MRQLVLAVALVLCFCSTARAGRPVALQARGHSAPEVAPQEPKILDYEALAERGVAQASRWRQGNWYCEYLSCTHGPYILLTIWGEVPMFEAVDALQIAHPSAAHRALVNRFGSASQHYWNPYLDGWAPYPEDRYRHAEAWFDDNGWLGLAFLNAYRATGEHRYLGDAERAFDFIAAQGWDVAGGGGMWWNTDHEYHSGPALAADSLLGALLYGVDHEHWQLDDVVKYVDWANAHDRNDSARVYLEKTNEPESVIDYVQAPLIYAQYLLCKDGEGESYCERAAQIASTMNREWGGEHNYGPEYDAIYLQWMMAYGQATGSSYWLEEAELNAAAADQHVADGQGLWLNSWWGGAIDDPETHPDMFRTMAATTSLFAWLSVYSRSG